jgi:hypothetical protein
LRFFSQASQIPSIAKSEDRNVNINAQLGSQTLPLLSHDLIREGRAQANPNVTSSSTQSNLEELT